jgi:hypothetical protein
MNEEMRARLRAIEATPLAASYDSVKDLVPPALLEAPQAGQARGPAQAPGDGAGTPPGASQGAEPGTQGQAEPGGVARKLLKGELDELKQLCGGRVNPDAAPDNVANPWRPEALARLREITALYNVKHDTNISRFTDLTVDVYTFVKEYLASQTERIDEMLGQVGDQL